MEIFCFAADALVEEGVERAVESSAKISTAGPSSSNESASEEDMARFFFSTCIYRMSDFVKTFTTSVVDTYQLQTSEYCVEWA